LGTFLRLIGDELERTTKALVVLGKPLAQGELVLDLEIVAILILEMLRILFLLLSKVKDGFRTIRITELRD
jgi:hypothetical protein